MSDYKLHLEELFKEDIYILNTDQSKKEYVQKDEVDKVEESPAVNIKSEKDESTFDETKIYIFSDYEIAKAEKQFLAKILKAVKVDLHSIKVAKWDKDAKEFGGKNFVFLSQITECGLTANRISAPPLHEIEQKIELKKELWGFMKKLFL